MPEIADFVMSYFAAVKYIDDESFYGCTALESVMFGNGVEEIGDYAFENCTSLSKVYIPVSVKKIGAEAFGYTLRR